MGLSLFQRLTHAVKVKDLASPLLPDLNPHATLNEGMSLQEGDGGREFYPHDVSLVKKEGRIVGWVNWHRLLAVAFEGREAIDTAYFPRGELDIAKHGDQICVGEVMYLPSPAILTADTPVFTAISKLVTSQSPFFFVLEEDLYVGTFAYDDLTKPPFRILLLSLLLEMEEVVLEWAMFHKDQSWAALSPGRQAKAIETARRNHPRSDPSKPGAALPSTCYTDKGTIAAKCGLASGMDRSAVKSLFSKAERLRNRCAHPTESPEILPQDELWPFLQDCHRVIDAVRAKLEN